MGSNYHIGEEDLRKSSPLRGLDTGKLSKDRSKLNEDDLNNSPSYAVLNLLSSGKMLEQLAETLSRFTKESGDAIVQALCVVLDKAVETSAPSQAHWDGNGIASLILEASKAIKLKLPEAGEIPLFKRVPGEKCSDFLKEHWQPYIDAGLLYQHILGAYDPVLLKGLRNEFAGRPEELRALLPTKADQTAHLLQATGAAPTPRARDGVTVLRRLNLAPHIA